jgi:hypothetical protein
MDLIVTTTDQLRQIVREELNQSRQLPKPIETETDPLLTLEQCQEFIEQKTGRKPAKQTIYSHVCQRTMPYKKFGKYLYFRRSTIESWLSNARQMN